MMTIYLLYVYEKEDEPQFERLYHKYDRKLLNISRYILKNEQDVMEVVQDAWFAISQNMHILRNLDDEKIEIYIYKTVKSKSINRYHQNKRIEYDFDCNVLANIPADTDISTEYAVKEEYKSALSCLNSMNHCYRDVLTLYFLYKMKPTQIAESLDRPLQTVKSQLRRGKQLLKDALEEWHHD